MGSEDVRGKTGKPTPTKRIPSSSVGVICPMRAVKGELQHPRKLWQGAGVKSIEGRCRKAHFFSSCLLSSSSLRQKRANLHDFFITFSSLHSRKASFSLSALSIIIQLGTDRGRPAEISLVAESKKSDAGSSLQTNFVQRNNKRRTTRAGSRNCHACVHFLLACGGRRTQRYGFVRILCWSDF